MLFKWILMVDIVNQPTFNCEYMIKLIEILYIYINRYKDFNTRGADVGFGEDQHQNTQDQYLNTQDQQQNTQDQH